MRFSVNDINYHESGHAVDGKLEINEQDFVVKKEPRKKRVKLPSLVVMHNGPDKVCNHEDVHDENVHPGSLTLSRSFWFGTKLVQML
jgi:hypothetical protein